MIAAPGWLSAYRPAWLTADLVAGITLAAYLIPAGVGDASLANLPPQAGLYACLFSGLVFWLFCSSRQTAITVTSAISLLVGSSLGEAAGGDASRFAVLAAATALVTGLIAFLAWALHAGTLVNFISESVLIGFKTGVALHLTASQIPKLLGFKGGHGDFWERSGHILSHVEQTNLASLLIGGVALVVLLVGRFCWRTIPVGLFVVIAGIVAGKTLDLDAYGVTTLGTVPHGVPFPSLPDVGWHDFNQILPLALACFLLGAVETAAIGRMLSAGRGQRFDSNRELLALAAANVGAGVGQGFPVSGGMSQSLVNQSAGAQTPLSGLIAAMVVLLVTLLLSGMLSALPQPVLAAVVLVAITGLFKFDALKRLWHSHRSEFVVAAAALLAVLGSGLLRGVLIGSLISLITLLRRASQPHVAILGRIAGTTKYSDAERHPDNEMIPGVLIVRPETSLFYFNVDHVCDMVQRLVRTAAVPVRSVIVDLSACPYLDLQAAHALAGMTSELAANRVGVHLVEVRSAVRDMLRVEGLETQVGGLDRRRSLADAVAAAAGGMDEA